MVDLRFDYIVDDAPLRTGRWLPHVAIPIVPSDRFDRDQPDVCLVTAWNYAADIRGKHPAFSGRWVQTFNLGRNPA
jgi:hypothetical protein